MLLFVCYWLFILLFSFTICNKLTHLKEKTQLSKHSPDYIEHVYTCTHAHEHLQAHIKYTVYFPKSLLTPVLVVELLHSNVQQTAWGSSIITPLLEAFWFVSNHRYGYRSYYFIRKGSGRPRSQQSVRTLPGWKWVSPARTWTPIRELVPMVCAPAEPRAMKPGASQSAPQSSWPLLLFGSQLSS